MELKNEQSLDVRTIPSPEKHPRIFSSFDALEIDQSFVLINDHDPVPLRYEFSVERTGTYTWDYLKRGPSLWHIRIRKVASGTGELSFSFEIQTHPECKCGH